MRKHINHLVSYAAVLCTLLFIAGCDEDDDDAAEARPAVKAAEKKEAPNADLVKAKLKEIAHIATTILDGDECASIVTERAEKWLFKKHPKDRWFGSDNYDVKQDVFIRHKKLLIRLSRLAEFPCDCNLWLKIRIRPEKIGMVIRQRNGLQQFYRFGQQAIDPPPEFKNVLEKGETVVIEGKKSDYISVLTPVRNSLDEVVGLVEVCTRLRLVVEKKE